MRTTKAVHKVQVEKDKEIKMKNVLRKLTITAILLATIPYRILMLPLVLWNRKKVQELVQELVAYRPLPEGVRIEVRERLTVYKVLLILWYTNSHFEFKQAIKALFKLDSLGDYSGEDRLITIKATPIFISSVRYTFMDTYFHELRHAVQHSKMENKYDLSRAQLMFGNVTYYDSWHERDARKFGRRATKVYTSK